MRDQIDISCCGGIIPSRLACRRRKVNEPFEWICVFICSANDAERLHPTLLAGLGQCRHAVSATEDLVELVNHATTSADSLLTTLQDTSVALNATMESVDKIFMAPGRNEPKPRNEKPFDIDSYTASALALACALKEANQLLNSTSGMLGSPRLEQRISTRISVELDAIAVSVNKYNPLDARSLKQLDGVFSASHKRGGESIKTWGQLGLGGDWADLDIAPKGPT